MKNKNILKLSDVFKKTAQNVQTQHATDPETSQIQNRIKSVNPNDFIDHIYNANPDIYAEFAKVAQAGPIHFTVTFDSGSYSITFANKNISGALKNAITQFVMSKLPKSNYAGRFTTNVSWGG